MLHRVQGLTVALDRDFDTEDPELHAIKAAIEMIKGIAAVRPIALTHDDYLARQRLRYELLEKIVDLFQGGR